MSLWREFRDSFSSAIAFPADYFAGWFGVAPSESGVEVNELTAMQIAAYVGCVRLIAGAMACTPLNIYERTSDGEKLAPTHPLQNVLAIQPNPEVCSADLLQTGQGHLLTTGNCYMEIAYNGAGQPAEIYLRSPYRTVPYRSLKGDLAGMGMKPGEIFYKTTDTPSGYERAILAGNMIHVKNYGMDSLVGLSPVKYYAREVLGSDLAAQSFSAKYFANSSAPNGYLRTSAMMTDENKKKTVASWMSGHSRGNAHRMAILDGGMDWVKVGVNPEEAQFIQTRGWNAKQIGTIFGVPMHFLGESEQSRANMEQRSIEFLIFTMKTWYVKWEQALNSKLFPAVGRNAGKYFCKFDTSQFERATYADLLRGVQMGRFAGLYTVNEGRKLLGEQPYTQAQLDSKDPGDKLFRPVNMVYVTKDDLLAPAEPASGADGEGQGGNDQSGGDGAGKVPSQTTQGGKRARARQQDAEIRRYYALFKPVFRAEFGKLLARKKRDSKDFRSLLVPVLISIASAFSFRADAPTDEMILSADIAQFIDDYILAMESRSGEWTLDRVDELAKDELSSSLNALREKCAVPSDDEPGPEEEEEEEEDDRHITVNVAAPVVNLSPELHAHMTVENKPTKKQGRMIRQPDGTMGFEIEESSTTILKATRQGDRVTIASEDAP